VRVLVLGGTQFLGPPVVRRLAEAGHDVVLFHRGVHEHPDASAAQHVHGEFGDFSVHVPELVRLRPDVVVDLVPYIDKAGHGVRHFRGVADRAVVITSQDVYRAFAILHGSEPSEAPQALPLTEDSELRTGRAPDAPPVVQIDNLETERALAGDPTLPVTVLRLPLIYGPHDPQRRIAGYVRRMDDGRPAIVLDERLARFRMSRGYVENVAAAVVLAATDERARARTYNVAEPHTPPWLDWLRQLADVCGWQGELVPLPPDRLPASLHFPIQGGQDIYASSERIRQELGYAEPVTPTDGLRSTVAWERQQQEGEPPADYADEDAVLGSTG
jgi:nucleoside-diphosphate-sugar epimerase